MLTMTPQARAVAAFSLAILLLAGHLDRLAVAVYVTVGGEPQSGDIQRLVFSLLVVAVAGAVLWFAHKVVAGGTSGWEHSLAQAGRLLALIGLASAVLGTIAVFTNDGGLYGPF